MVVLMQVSKSAGAITTNLLLSFKTAPCDYDKQLDMYGGSGQLKGRIRAKLCTCAVGSVANSNTK